MASFVPLRRALSLTLCLLSACAAAGPEPSSRRDAPPTGALAAFLTGRMALSSAEFDRAADSLFVALAADPANVDLHRQAFTAALVAGRPEAVALARALPDNPMARLYLATLDARLGRWAEAEQGFAELPNRGPLLAVQPILIAWTRHGAGRTDEALAGLRAAMDQGGARSLIALHAALIADQADRGMEAEPLYQRAVANPNDMHVRLAFLMASWQARTGRMPQALALMDQIQAAVPDVAILRDDMEAVLTERPVDNANDGIAEAFLALGGSLRSENTNDLSLMILTLATVSRPRFAAARLAISDTHLARRHTDAALAAIMPVRNSESLAPLVRLRRAALLTRMDRADEAIPVLRDLSRDVPHGGVPDRHLGDIYRMKSRFGDAIAAYDRAIGRLTSITPADWILFYHRGIALDRDGQWDRAEADFRQALQLAPDQPYALNYLAYSWTERGVNLDQARAMLEQALQARPNDGAITDSLGWVLFRQGHLTEALRLLERATELEPDDPTINSHLGDVYWAVGRRIEALYQWRRALTLNPSPEEATQLRDKIRPDYAGPTASK